MDDKEHDETVNDVMNQVCRQISGLVFQDYQKPNEIMMETTVRLNQAKD